MNASQRIVQNRQEMTLNYSQWVLVSSVNSCSGNVHRLAFLFLHFLSSSFPWFFFEQISILWLDSRLVKMHFPFFPKSLSSWSIRIEIYSSGNRIISPENQNFYNVSITLHGLLMIFFLVMAPWPLLVIIILPFLSSFFHFLKHFFILIFNSHFIFGILLMDCFFIISGLCLLINPSFGVFFWHPIAWKHLMASRWWSLKDS